MMPSEDNGSVTGPLSCHCHKWRFLPPLTLQPLHLPLLGLFSVSFPLSDTFCYSPDLFCILSALGGI